MVTESVVAPCNMQRFLMLHLPPGEIKRVATKQAVDIVFFTIQNIAKNKHIRNESELLPYLTGTSEKIA